MALVDDLKATLGTINANTDAIKVELEALAARVAGGLSADEGAEVGAALTALADKTGAIASEFPPA